MMSGDTCETCGRTMEAGWVTCPYCAGLSASPVEADAASPLVTPGVMSAWYTSRDNLGTRVSTADEVYAQTMGYEVRGKSVACVVYEFPGKGRAEVLAAMLHLPCMHMAVDTKELVCCEPMEFGVYENEPEDERSKSVWEAILRGEALTAELFELARLAFTQHGGVQVTAVAPGPPAGQLPVAATVAELADSDDAVEFLRENRLLLGRTVATKRRYRASSRSAALSYLRKQDISEAYYYIEVETPDGLFGKDKDGAYMG
jgi:hypothetical protein